MSTEQRGIPFFKNGDQVVGFMKANEVKSIQGYQDLASLHAWYHEDPDNNHLGMVNLWGNQKMLNAPIYRELLQNKQKLEVNGLNGRFTYDTPIETESKGLYTEKDMSVGQEYAGIDGSSFKIALNREVAHGTVITYDAMDGQQLFVSDEEPVELIGSAYIHTVKLVTQDRQEWFPSEKLAKGLEYFKINHGLGEYSTNFAHVDFDGTVGYMKSEFELGNVRGVEAYVTGFADKKKFSGAAVHSKNFIQQVQNYSDRYGDLMFCAPMGANGKPNMSKASIGSTMEYLVMLELEKLTATSLLFQRAGTIRDTNGNVKFNEGLWHQLRRGKIITYGRPGGITREHIKEAAEYVFRVNPSMPYESRRIKFKCGTRAYDNVMEIFSDEVTAQLNNLDRMLGTDRVLPKSPVEGKNLYDLTLKPVRFTSVYIPQIGMIEIEKDESLDYAHMVDRFSAGYHGEGKSRYTYSMVIWDASSQVSSNNGDLPKGTKVVEGGNKNGNIYIVKPEGAMTYWGKSNGRYDIDKAGGIVSSYKQIGQEFWAWNSCAIWVKDISKFVMIELDKDAAKGFN